MFSTVLHMKSLPRRRMIPNHIESVTQFPEAGKATMRRENSEASCQTYTCGCKHGQTRVESVEKIDRATLAVDCTQAEFRTFETSLYQVLHRTTANEPLKVVQQVEGQRGFEAWLLIVRRYDQRNTSDKSSLFAAPVSNITEKDRAKDVEQFHDVLRAFKNEMTKFENRFGKIRDEEKVLAVKKLMPEILLNYRFRGTAMSYDELIIALENIIIDKVPTMHTTRSKKHDTSAPMEIGMATKEDGESTSQDEDQRIIDLALQAVYKGFGKGKWGFGKGQSWSAKDSKGGKGGGKSSWQKGSGKKGRKGRDENVLDMWKDRTHCSRVQERKQQELVRNGRRSK